VVPPESSTGSLVGVVLSLLLLAVIASSWTAAVLRQERNTANQARDTARRELWFSKVNEARAITVSREPDRRSRALRLVQEALAIAAPEQISALERTQIRSVAASALLLPEVTEVRRWRPREAQPDSWMQTVDFDEALETFAVRLKGGWVSLRRTADDTEILQSPSLNRNPVVNLSASGTFLAITDRVPAFERLEIWNVRTRPASLVHRSMGSFGKFVVFAVDDTRAAYFRRNAGLEVVDLLTKAVTTLSTPSKDPWRPLAFDGAGTRLAYPDEAVTPSVIRIHDVRLNKQLATIRIGDHVDGIAWHPSGETLAIGRADETIWLVDIATRQLLTSYVGHTARGISLSFNHRGDRLLSNDWENRLRIWDVGSRQEILSFPCRGRMFRIHRDDELLATEGENADDSLRILRLNPGRALRTLQQPGGRRLRWDATLVGGVHPVAWGTTTDSLAARRGLGAASLETGVVVSVANHPSDHVAAVLADGSVVSFGRGGVVRWPMLATKEPEEIVFGTPVTMHPHSTVRQPGIAGNGQLMAIPCDAEGALLVREGSDNRMLREGLADIRSVAVNADGTLVALANFNKPVDGGNIRIVDGTTCRVVAALEAPLNSYVSFSRDGRWLMAQMVTSTSNCRIWRVGHWSTPLDVDGLAVTIDATGTLAASSDSRGNVRIFRLKDGSDVVRLALPGEESLFVKSFSEDGSILLVGSEKYEAARLIDLRMIREELAALGLDWEDVPLSHASPPEIRVRWNVDPHP
jgi:WD40 repeat protein